MNPDFVCLFWWKRQLFASLLHLDWVTSVPDHLCLLAGPTALPEAEPAGRRGALWGRETTNATPLCKQCLLLEVQSFCLISFLKVQENKS